VHGLELTHFQEIMQAILFASQPAW